MARISACGNRLTNQREMPMKTLTLASVPALSLAGTAMAAEPNPMVGGAPIFADRNIVENAVNNQSNGVIHVVERVLLPRM